MKKYFLLTLILVLLCLALWGTKSGIALSAAAPADTTFTLGEGIDFATRVLADPWDMSNFTDISQGINHSAGNDLVNIQISNGVFSARTSSSYSEFYPLYPGYEPGLNSGKIGARFPIDSSAYSCAYVAMYANWSTTDNNYLILTWARDRLLDKSGVYGQSYGNFIPKNLWQLFRIDLKNPPHLNNNGWTSQKYWQAFRITPSLVAGTQFYIDWVRLTNCQPVYANLSGLPQGTYRIWFGSPKPQILAIDSFSPSANGSYAWDVQGLAAGNYTYIVVKKSDGSIIQQGQVNIVGSPIVTFTSPSQYSGQDYANSQGNPWDMDPTDVTRIDCVTYGFTNGILSLDTTSRACAGPGANEADPHIFLNSADHGNLSIYRYLSFSSSTSGYPWSVPDLGMIVRLFWSLDRPGYDCWYGSRAIALDNGWQTYTIDLYDPLNGMPEEKTPADCPLVSWRDQAAVGPVVGFRIDPNENITGGVMHQEFDWIRLTKVEQASQGKTVKIHILLNKPTSDVSMQFYYTTDLSQPTQNPASTNPKTISAAANIVYLPLVFTIDPNYDPFVDKLPADLTYVWNTSGVAPGQYYVCAKANDGYNQATYCSQAPVQINP
jgi:hypothetical protein